MATTRLGLYGGARPSYGSFADKESTVKPRLTRLGLHGGARPPYSDHSRAAIGKSQSHITRLGQHGGPRMRYSSFAKSVAAVVGVAEPTGGGRQLPAWSRKLWQRSAIDQLKESLADEATRKAVADAFLEVEKISPTAIQGTIRQFAVPSRPVTEPSAGEFARLYASQLTLDFLIQQLISLKSDRAADKQAAIDRMAAMEQAIAMEQYARVRRDDEALILLIT